MKKQTEMKKKIGIVLIISLFLVLFQTSKVKANPNWLTGWNKRVKIEIDCGDIDSDLSSFPVLIFLSNSSAGQYDEDVSCVFDEVGSNSKKIALTVGETEETYVEIEKWDSTNEQAWLWANVTASSSVNTTLYLYYDNDHADNTVYVDDTNVGNSANVWDSNFKMVQHMCDNTTSSVVDSTQYDNDGTKFAANEPIETDGNISKAQSFDGEDDYIEIPTSGMQTSAGTVSLWIKLLEAPPEANAIFFSHYITGKDARIYLTSLADLTFDVGFSDSSYIVTSHTLTLNSWEHLVLTWVKVNGTTTIKAYANGVNVLTRPDSVDLEAISSEVRLGEPVFTLHLVNCVIDEVHILNQTLTADEIKASYESGRDHLLDFGSEKEIYFIAFYNNAGGQFEVNGTIITNGTTIEYNISDILILKAYPDGNKLFANYTWDSSYTLLNPYNLNLTTNFILWCFFDSVPESTPVTNWMIIPLVFGLAAIALVLKHIQGDDEQ